MTAREPQVAADRPQAAQEDSVGSAATDEAADAPPNGTLGTSFGKPCVYYDGYWIRHYPPPEDTLTARKALIEHLSRRLFHHTEPGINTPGHRLDAARTNHDRETDPARKRVAAAMLAGALFNRATDIFTTVVELQGRGVEISPRNELMRECGAYFREALELGKQVKHYSGHEGIDELWGEPFKAFTMPIADFYETRYLKIAMTMRDIDRIARVLCEALRNEAGFTPVLVLADTFADAAKRVSETMRADPATFEVWPRFVAASEALLAFTPAVPDASRVAQDERTAAALRLIRDGRDLITYIGGARVPMPKSMREYFAACEAFAGRAIEPDAAG